MYVSFKVERRHCVFELNKVFFVRYVLKLEKAPRVIFCFLKLRNMLFFSCSKNIFDFHSDGQDGTHKFKNQQL